MHGRKQNLIWNGAKTLEITPIFNGVTRTFSYTQAWMSEGGQEFENFNKTVCFLSSSGKTKISPFLAPLEKRLEKSTCGLFEKILPTPMPTSMLNYTIFG